MGIPHLRLVVSVSSPYIPTPRRQANDTSQATLLAGVQTENSAPSLLPVQAMGRWFINSGETAGGPGDGSNPPLPVSLCQISQWHFHPICSPVTAAWSLDWCASGRWITIKHLFLPHLLPPRQLHQREASLRGSPRWRWNAETGAVSHPVQGEHLHLRPFWRASRMSSGPLPAGGCSHLPLLYCLLIRFFMNTFLFECTCVLHSRGAG